MLSPILSCLDIRQSIEFYTKLGFTEKWCMNDDIGHPSFACVEFHGAEILLGTIDFVPEDKREVKGIGIQLYIEVPLSMSIENMYQIALQHKMEITKPLETRNWGEKVFVVNDIDGYNLMLAQRLETN